MSEIDVVILALMLWAGYNGWKHGLIKELASMAGFFVGLYVAYTCYDKFGEILAPCLSSNTVVTSYLVPIIAFVILWAVVPILLGLVASILTKSLKCLHLGPLNSLGGMVVSLVKYLVLLSFIFSAMNYLHILNDDKKKDSMFYDTVASIAQKLFDGKTLPFHKDKCNTDTLPSDTKQL